MKQNTDHINTLFTIHAHLWITDKNGITSFISQDLSSQLGYDSSDIINSSIHDYIDTQSTEEFINHCEDCMTHKNYEGDYMFSEKNGQLLRFHIISSAQYGNSGNLQGFVHSVQDSPHCLDPKAPIATHSPNDNPVFCARKDLFVNISHELRTPLNAILGFSQVLLGDQSGNFSLQQREYLGHIYQSGAYLLELVNDILDLSKLEAKKIALDDKPFNVNRVLTESISIIRSMANEKNITIHSELDESTGLLNADETRLKQIMYNLLSNAVKFTEKGKDIGVICTHTAEDVIIKVWDQGIGIDEHDYLKIYEPFRQLKSNPQRKISGSGLGLAIIKKIIDLHNGSISVSSKPGEGSTFTVTLPGRRPIISCKKTNKPVQRDNSKQKTILVVDDDRISQRLLEETLKNYDYHVLTANDGEKALGILEQQKVDCVLTDILMPKVSGIELLEAIRKTEKNNLPVIALTGFTTDDICDKLSLTDFDYYFTKPIDLQNLLHLLDEIFGNNKTEGTRAVAH